MYGIFGRETTNYMVIHGVYIYARFWLTLLFRGILSSLVRCAETALISLK